MIGNRKVIAIIPARGGSKRLPFKNILPLSGKPLIAWTIEAAQQSKYIDQVIVNTDDDSIIEVAKKYNAEVPYKRPTELGGDNTTTNDVLIHAVNKLDMDLAKVIVVVLQPTSPLRKSENIDQALELIEENMAEGVVSLCECSHSPIWSNTLPENKSLGLFIQDKYKGVRSQDLPKYYRLNGAIYIYTAESLVSNGGIFYSDKVFAYTMTEKESVDIDTQDDFDYAELLLQKIS